LDSLRPDIVGLSEYSSNFASGDAETRSLVFGGYGHFAEGGQEGFQSNALASRLALEHVRVIPFEARRQKAYRLEADTVVLGRKTHLVQTHLDLDAEVRRKQIRELADALADEDCVLLSGDFNVGSLEEYRPLLDVGFVSANPGPCGVWPTHRRRRMELTPAIDNVLVRGFEIADVRTADRGLLLSDHRLIVVRIRRKR